MMRSVGMVVGGMVFILAMVGGPAAAQPATEGLPVVSFDAFEFGFHGADHLDPGRVVLQVVNTGKEAHQLQLVKLDDKHTAADFAAAIKADPVHLPRWGRLAGGPNGVVAGARSRTIQTLEPGNYVLVCWLPDANGVPHLTLGMTKSVTVKAGTPEPGPEILPDITISLADFSYKLSKPVTAGHHTFNVINLGQQVHETLVVQLPPKGSVKAYAAALAPGKPPSGAPPGKPIGGVVGLAPGDHALFDITLSPGRYGLVCLFPDHDTGQPHFEKGMTLEFDVK